MSHKLHIYCPMAIPLGCCLNMQEAQFPLIWQKTSCTPQDCWQQKDTSSNPHST